MWAREQSIHYLKQYIRARKATPWVVNACPSSEERARSAIQYLGGMAGDWYPYRSDCSYYHPQKVKE